jgi:hypothetical protein
MNPLICSGTAATATACDLRRGREARSDDSSYINGAAIPVDGGVTIGADLVGLGTTLGS